MALRFDEVEHRFWTPEGIERLGVSRIMRDGGLLSDFAIDQWSSEFGKAGHKMIELDLKGLLNEGTIQEQLKPTFYAWRKFLKKFPLSPIIDSNGWFLERPLENRLYKYAGIPDLPMIDVRTGQHWLLDIKTCSAKQVHWEVQLRAYEAMVREELGLGPRERIILADLWLPRGSDEPRLVTAEDPTAWPCFLGCLNVAKWKEKHGKASRECVHETQSV